MIDWFLVGKHSPALFSQKSVNIKDLWGQTIAEHGHKRQARQQEQEQEQEQEQGREMPGLTRWVAPLSRLLVPL